MSQSAVSSWIADAWEKWTRQQPKCIGYPECDGDLIGQPHTCKCPLFAFAEAAWGKSHMITFRSAYEEGAREALERAAQEVEKLDATERAAAAIRALAEAE